MMSWDVLGNSVRGASHKRSGIECQDSYKKIQCDDGTLIMAIADGHGSKNCPYSKTGSSIAVNVFCKVMSEYLSNYNGSYGQLITYLNREGDTKIAKEIDLEWKKRIEKVHRRKKREIPTDNSGHINSGAVYSLYGTTLLGLVLAKEFIFAYQLGDGDIISVGQNSIESVVLGDRILGVETHSLCKDNSWEKAITTIRRIGSDDNYPRMLMLSTDGFANSYKDETEFFKTCREYYETINQYGIKAVGENLKSWLSETSEMGCGDDITLLIAYCDPRNN